MKLTQVALTLALTGVVSITAIAAHIAPAHALSGYKAYREVSDVTKAEYPPGFTQYFDQKLLNVWGLAADTNPCYIYTSMTCHGNAAAPPIYPEQTSSDAAINAEATDALRTFWVVDNDSNYVTNYDDTGMALSTAGAPLAVMVAGKPTGIATNPYCAPTYAPSATSVVYTSACNTLLINSTVTLPFTVKTGTVRAASTWLAAGRDGRIYGWNPNVSRNQGIVVIDDSAAGADYTGLSISPDGAMLAIADFHNGKIVTYNNAYQPVTFYDSAHNPVPLRDPSVPAGYAPSNVAFISYPAAANNTAPNYYPAGGIITGNHLYVTYGEQKATPFTFTPEVVGPPAPNDGYVGNFGYVSDFTLNPDGTFSVRQFVVPSDKLNAPWGIALAPSLFGIDGTSPAGYEIYIGNFGDGYINVFDATTVTYQGRLGENVTAITPPDNTVPGYPTVGDPSSPSPVGQTLWEPGLRGLAFKPVAYQVTPIPITYDWANRLFFNANLNFTVTNPANEWSIFGFIRPT